MENVTHTLAGLALARAGLGRTSRLATTALVIGANLPDVDLAWSSFRNPLTYFQGHRGFTHSLAGLLVLTLLLWAVLLAIDRMVAGRVQGEGARPGPLLIASALGVLSHGALDALNSYGIRPFLPWSGDWRYGDLLVIVDPWLWLVLGGAVFVTARGGRRRPLAWGMGAAAAAIVVLFTPVVPVAARAGWAAGLAVTVAFCWWVVRGSRLAGAKAAVAAIGLVLAYVGLCALAHERALLRVRDLAGPETRAASGSSGGTGVQFAALPRPADPLHWEGLVIDDRTIRHRVVGITRGLDPEDAAWVLFERRLDDKAAMALWAGCAGRAIREFFRFPFVAIEPREDGGRDLVVRDARYARQGRGFAVFTATLQADGLPAVDPGLCPP